MKILVTGANGFLGSAVVARLLDRGISGIICLVRPGSNHEKLITLGKENPNKMELFFGSLNRESDCRQMVREVDLIYHLAAAKSGSAAEMFLNSSVATKNLLNAVCETGREIRFVHCSSFGVYGAAKVPHGAVIDENTPLEPTPQKRDIYSLSKLHQEKVVSYYHEKKGIPTVILRPGVIYGPQGVAISPRVGLDIFGLFLHLGRKNQLPLSYVDNCAEAFAFIGETSGFNGEIYNVLDNEFISSKEFLKLYRKEVNKIRFITLPYWATWMMSLACEKYFTFSNGQLPDIFTRYKTANMWKGHRFSNDKLQKSGWRQLITMSEGLNRHFSYLRLQLQKSILVL